MIKFLSLTSLLLTLMAMAGWAEPYRLAAGDTLEITLLENTQVNGAYRIDVDGTVSVPGVGVISAAGKDVRTFEADLIAQAATSIVDPSIAVQIIAYRPFFVFGDVQQSGQFEYVPGLTAMKAVAIAGGFGRQIDTDDVSREIAASPARRSLVEARIGSFAAEVRLARLQAERDMSDAFSFTLENATAPEQSIIDAAEQLFITRQEAFLTRREKLEQELVARGEEIDGFEAQLALQDGVLANSREELRQILEMRERGLTSNAQVNDITRLEQSVRAQILQISTLKRQAEVGKAAVERELAEYIAGRNLSIDQELRALEESLQQFAARIVEDSATLTRLGSSQPSSGIGAPIYRLELFKEGADQGEATQMNAAILPGDTLFVIQDDAPLRSN